MADAEVRVALLARAGTARDQLHRALEEAGAQIVAEGDPGELDPAQVDGTAPTIFLVSLEPAIEAALERFDALLAAPGIEVMYDDAEVTSKLDGWDLNRWARHIASKVLGSEGLPPAPGGSQAMPEASVGLAPGLPPTPAELMDHARLEDYTTDTSELADWVPSSPSLTPASASGADDFAASELSWESPASASVEGEFNLDTDLGLDLDLSELDMAPVADQSQPTDFSEGDDTPLLADLDLGEGVRFSSFEKDAGDADLGDLDADVAHLAAQLEAFEKNDQRSAAVDPGFLTAVAAETAPEKRQGPALSAATAPAPEQRSGRGTSGGAPSFDFSSLSLAPTENAPPMPSSEPIVAKFSSAAPAMELSLEAVDGGLSNPAPAVGAAPTPTAAAPARGAVLVLAGLGGPDAVRQLLSSLPERLDVPVLLYQHLEVGKHERLVDQMAKISRLPVVLALEGGSPEAGKVTMLPAGMTATSNGNGLVFGAGPMSDLISALAPTESMVIVLSGTDPQLVPLILGVKGAGGTVLAQDPEVCFDAAAADAMRREGASVYPALGLAKQIASRWPG